MGTVNLMIEDSFTCGDARPDGADCLHGGHPRGRVLGEAEGHQSGGISGRGAPLRFLYGLRGLKLIGGDVVEVAPPYDQTGNTALVGASIMFEILCLVADSNFAR